MFTENVTSTTLFAERPAERGQAIVLVMVSLGLFVLVAVALAVDFSYLWFHRQAAQTAADAACTAGVMDMLAVVNKAPTGAGGINPNFTTGTAFDCFSTSTAAPCWYAAENGFSSTLTHDQVSTTGTTAGINVYVSFPDKSACPAGSSCPVPGITPATVITSTLIRVDVVDRAQNFFMGLLSSSHTTDVKAAAICGLVNAKAAPPIGLLAPTGTSLDNKGVISIIGGSDLTFAINSASSTAVSITGSGKINIVYGGHDYCGGQLLVFGGPASPPSGFITSCPDGSCPTPAPTCSGTARTPEWISPGTPSVDPYSSFAAPTTAGLATNPAVVQVDGGAAVGTLGTDGCPDVLPKKCDEYSPGVYTSQIQVKNKTAIFNPGIYYVTGGFVIDSNSCVRPATASAAGTTAGGGSSDGTGGTMFYFADNNTFSVKSNGGDCTGLTDFTTSTIKCTASVALPSYIPTSFSGVSVLTGPCTGTYGDPNPDADDLTANPSGRQRGILFFQNRSQAATVDWIGNTAFLTAGGMYFHQCTVGASGASDPGANATCSSSAYQSLVQFKGTSGSASWVLGAIIADKMQLSGGTSINMGLVNNTVYNVLKVGLFR